MNKKITLKATLAIIFLVIGVYSINSFDSSSGNPGVLLTIPVGVALIVYGMIILFKLLSEDEDK